MLQGFLSFTEAECRGKYDENQSVKFCAGKCECRRRSLDNLLAASLADARSNDESDHKSVSYGNGQVRLCDFTGRRDLGTYRMEFIRGHFRVDSGDDLQPSNQELKQR